MGRDNRVKRPRYVAIDIDRHGNERIYYRVPGKPKIRLRGPLFSDDFWTDYQAARAARPVSRKAKAKPDDKGAPRGSFRELCVKYFSSRDFKRLAPRTRYVRRMRLEGIYDEHGTKPARLLEARHVRALADKKADRLHAANLIIKDLRAVYDFGMKNEIVPANPAKLVEYQRPLKGSDGFHAWTPEEIERYEAAHPIGTMARLAFDLMIYTGQRRGDVVKLGPQHVRDGRLNFKQEKTGRDLSIPIHPALAASIEATPTGNLVFLQSELGRPFSSSNSFGNRMRKWCDAAGLDECSAHGLRKATVIRLAEAGCSTLEIMAITGHRTVKEVERYAKARNEAILADNAMAKYAGENFSAENVPPEREPVYGGTIPSPKSLTKKEAKRWLVPRGGIEPPTRGFSVRCSTN
jgi:integrase